MRKLLQAVIIAGLLTAFPVTAEIKVVATQTSLADLAERIGGDRVEVRSVASPRFNPHFIEPRPSDVLKVKRAELLVHTGLDLEPWRAPLVNAAGNVEVRPGGARELDASRGVPLLEIPDAGVTRALGDVHAFGNPHYLLSPRNGAIVAAAIAAKLTQLDPDGEAIYAENLRQFNTELSEAESRWQRAKASLANAAVVSYHKEWEYLFDYLGMRPVGYLEPKPGVPPAPRHILSVIGTGRAQAVRAVVQASYFPPDAGAEVARSIGAKHIILCQNVEELPECADYLQMIDYNIKQLISAYSDRG